jgi:class 3 adenylate cyclase/tetratricopeptide (TPR) repeat protein
VPACVECGTEHDAEARFCSACGATLSVACPGCGAEQPAADAFCSRCGTALGDATPSPRATVVDDRQERRVVTVLFADLAGSTALAERLDPEELRELQGELFALVNGEVERHGGTTEKFVGDAILAVFGIPQAHDDDPERAVRTALAVQRRFGAFANAIRARHGAELGLRIGVNTGDVVAGREAAARGDLMVSGDAVNVAARLQQHAEPGSVLVGARTQFATSRSIAYERAPAVDAKGKAEPVPAWIARAPIDEPGARGVAGLSAPLIGRDEELDVLGAVARRVERDRVPQLVTVFGPAGVGKSRLLRELVERLPETLVLHGRCLPYGEGITYRPLAEAAKARAGILDSEPSDAALAKLRDTVARDVPEHAGRVLEAFAWTIGLAMPDAADGQDVTPRLHEAWRRYLDALGRDRPTILVVEDIHWASDRLLDLLEHVADTLADTAVLIVCAARPELLDSRPTWGAGKLNAIALQIGPLDGDQAARLVSELLGHDSVPEAVRRRVLASTEGNPFFVEEMLHMLIEQGAIERHGDRWQPSDGLSRIAVPDSVHGVIAARLDLLDTESREAIRRCAVVGRVFWPEAAEVREHVVAGLAPRGLVAEHPTSSMAGRREFSFKHALTRDVAYASLPRPERRDLHRRVGEWLLEVAPDRGVETAELAAYHYAEALTYGETSPAVSRRASELLSTAGLAALQRGSYDDSRRQLDRAAELATDDATRAVAALHLGRLEATVGAPDDALRHLDLAVSLAGNDDATLRADVLSWRSRALWLSGRWDEALAAATESVETLEGRPDSPQRARALARRSQLAMLRSDPKALQLAEEALAVAERVGDAFGAVNSRINISSALAMTRNTAPDPDDVLRIVDDAIAIGAAEEAYRALANFLWNATGYLHVDEIVRVYEQASEKLADLPRPAAIGLYVELSLAAMQLLPAGRWDEVDETLAAMAVSQRLPITQLVWFGLTAQLATRRGDLRTAEDCLAELPLLALASSEPQRIVPMACAFAPWAHLAGRRDELRRVVTDSVEAVRGRWSGVISALPLVRTLHAAGETELLEQVLDSMQPTAGAELGAKLATSHLAAQAFVALRARDAGRAVELLERAVAAERALGYTFDTAVLELDLAGALEAHEPERARAIRDGAKALMLSIGCVNPL